MYLQSPAKPLGPKISAEYAEVAQWSQRKANNEPVRQWGGRGAGSPCLVDFFARARRARFLPHRSSPSHWLIV